jgi:hypothetical protein
MGKQERERRRAAYADVFNDGFTMGYNMGYEQGAKDTAEQANRNILKFAHRGK